MMITQKKLAKILLEAEADSYNAGFGKKVMRVVLCKDSGTYVKQHKQVSGDWLCLHDGDLDLSILDKYNI